MLKLIRIIRSVSAYFLLLWMITIILVSSTPNLPVLKIHTSKSEIRLDYFMHFCEYGFLAFMAYLAFAGRFFDVSLKKFSIITILLLIFAVADELHQKFIPGRTYNPRDLAGNFLGIFAAMVFSIIVFRRMSKT